MKRLSQVEKIVEFLKSNPNQKFKAREIALAITQNYSEDYQSKKSNFETEKEFLQQIVAEIGSQKSSIEKHGIQMQDKPRPRLYWYALDNENIKFVEENFANDDMRKSFSEQDLYPVLIDYLSQEMNLHCLRIDEKRSKNNRGENGNQWLHPDIVAMQALDLEWDSTVQKCVKNSTGQSVRLWSFEVKKELNSSNIRSSFFQAVSNSSWANEGYLVATAITGNQTFEELRILSDLHGIGVIILNLDDISSSEILIPAKRKVNIDWQSVNRIVEENKDFAKFIKYLSIYYQTGEIIKENWNK